MNGLFVSFEGVDGVGKTTQVERLRAYLEAQGRTVVVTREPGGTALGKAIRQLLLHGVDGGAVDIAPRAEALLFAADRAQHVAETIRPALERGEVVITDRYLDSSLAYQAGGRELTPEEIRSLSMWATNNLLPDRTYLLDMDPALSHHRLEHAEDRMESAGDDFQSRRPSWTWPPPSRIVSALSMRARALKRYGLPSNPTSRSSHERMGFTSRPKAGNRHAQSYRAGRPEPDHPVVADLWTSRIGPFQRCPRVRRRARKSRSWPER